MAYDTMSLSELNEELHFQKQMLRVISDQEMAKEVKEKAVVKCTEEINKLEQEILQKTQEKLSSSNTLSSSSSKQMPTFNLDDVSSISTDRKRSRADTLSSPEKSSIAAKKSKHITDASRNFLVLSDSSDSDCEVIDYRQFKSGNHQKRPTQSPARPFIDLTNITDEPLPRPKSIARRSHNPGVIAAPAPHVAHSSILENVGPAVREAANAFQQSFAHGFGSGPFDESSDGNERLRKDLRDKILFDRTNLMTANGARAGSDSGDLSVQDAVHNLLKNIEDETAMPKEARKDTPKGLVHPLFEHQRIALSWMIKCEELTSHRGGILADDMGLGKTISTLALLLARPSGNGDRKTTLIVAPLSVLAQWQSEIEEKIKPRYRLRTHIHHKQKKLPWEKLRRFDVVFTSYSTLSKEFAYLRDTRASLMENPDVDRSQMNKRLPLLGTQSLWYRVILDEAHNIKNRKALQSDGCCELKATYRWGLTGTPMMNNVEEFFSLLRFLRIKPYNHWDRFREDFRPLLNNPSVDQQEELMPKLRTVIKSVMLRRTKKTLIDGKPILQLPEKIEVVDHVVLDDDQQIVYSAIASMTEMAFNRYHKAGTVGKNYAHILVLLLRLRQAVCHPHLICDLVVDRENSSTEITLGEMIEFAETLPPDVIARIMAMEQYDCSVCYEEHLKNPKFLLCGHHICSSCFDRIFKNEMNREAVESNCPFCRHPVAPTSFFDLTAFKQAHMEEIRDDVDDDDNDESDIENDGTDDDHVSDEDNIGSETKSKGKAKAQRQDELTDESDLDDIVPRDFKKYEPPLNNSKPKDKRKTKVEEFNLKKLDRLRIKSKKSNLCKEKYKKYLAKHYVPSAKITKCMEIVEDAIDRGTKTIIFSLFTSLLDLIEIPLGQSKITFGRYDGSMKTEARDAEIKNFRSLGSGYDVLLVSLTSGNAGLNLIEATNIVIMDPFWNPFVERQAVDRAHRIGQTKEVLVHRIIVKGSVEDRILQLQEDKKTLVDGALDESALQKLGGLGTNELRYLLTGRRA